jgi:hypothetical protein
LAKLPAAMGLVVAFFLALAAATVSYAFGQGGPIAGMVFLAVLFVGAAGRVLRQTLNPGS